MQEQFPSISEEKILDKILILENERKLVFSQEQLSPTNPADYPKIGHAIWYWITLATALAAVISAFTIPENAYPIVIVRYVLGSIFILWLPGYTLIRALFPARLPIKSADKDMDIIERIAISIGMSLAVVSLTALLLNYTPWGIRLTPVTISLTALTLTFATAAVLRERRSSRKSASQT